MGDQSPLFEMEEDSFLMSRQPPPELQVDSDEFMEDGNQPISFTVRPQVEYSGDDVVAEPDVFLGLEPFTVKAVSHYLIGAMLGSGSYADVKDAMDIDTLERRAAKIIKKKKIRKIPHGEANVEREIKIHRKLCHKNIIRIYDVIRLHEKEKIYIMMEYAAGCLQNMLDAAEEERLPVWQAHYFFRQLIQGLDYLHNVGVIHKDIKPGNLMVSNEYLLKICDFGVSEELSLFKGNDIITSSQGSLLVQPPEVALGEVDEFSGTKLDIWSSGITLFKMVTGVFPFMGKTPYQLYENVGNCEYEIPAMVDDLLADLFRAILCKDYHQRITISGIQSHAWFRRKQYIDGPPVMLPSSKATDDYTNSMTMILALLANRAEDPVTQEMFRSAEASMDMSNTFTRAPTKRPSTAALLFCGGCTRNATTDDVEPEQRTPLVPNHATTADGDCGPSAANCNVSDNANAARNGKAKPSTTSTKHACSIT